MTLNWNRYWTTTNESEEARKFAVKMADMISDFIRDKISINSVADYGCGPATLLFVLAKRFPHKEFYGFDIAGSVIKENTERALQLNLQNLHFEQDSLPNPCKKRKFDLVMCFATLHYVKEIKVAIRNLFELINPGGYLIFNYPNTFTRAAYRRDIEPNDNHMKRRFALVLAGENDDYIKDSDFRDDERILLYKNRFSLEECLYLIRDSRFVVGNDTGLVYIADALEKPVFVVDNYTMRIFRRLGYFNSKDDYDSAQRFFMKYIAPDVALYNEYHACLVALGNDACNPRPRCGKCPLNGKIFCDPTRAR